MESLALNPSHADVDYDDLIESHDRLGIDSSWHYRAQRLQSIEKSIKDSIERIKHNLIMHNPCDVVLIQDYEKQHGKALTKDEERLLLRMTDGTPYQIMFAVALYTGLRPNEYNSATIDGNFIVAKNSKQKDGKLHTKRIPITPMLAPYIPASGIFPTAHKNSMTAHFKMILPNHKLYDMRTTFYSRCIECGVAEIARKLFMGHTLGALGNAYTDISDEYLLTEGNKLKY